MMELKRKILGFYIWVEDESGVDLKELGFEEVDLGLMVILSCLECSWVTYFINFQIN